MLSAEWPKSKLYWEKEKKRGEKEGKKREKEKRKKREEKEKEKERDKRVGEAIRKKKKTHGGVSSDSVYFKSLDFPWNLSV